MSRETRMAIEHSTPMLQRFESGVSARYETKVFSLWDRKRGTKLAPSLCVCGSSRSIVVSRSRADSITLKNFPADIPERAN
jgi:hypothetical protein